MRRRKAKKACPKNQVPDIKRGRGCTKATKKTLGNSLNYHKPLATNPMDYAAQKIKSAFEHCKDKRGFVFWQNKRWFVEDDRKNIYAALDANPGCNKDGVDFTQVKSNLGAVKKRR